MPLQQVLEQGQKIAEAIATVLHVEVEIVDTQLVRIAGTGIIRHDVGTKMRSGLINKHVMQTKKPVVIEKAGYHQICHSCPLMGNCYYKASIVYPILVKNDVVGMLSLTAFSDEQKATLCKNQDSLLEFVERMADLISSKIVEEEMMHELVNMTSKLETVVDTVHEAMVAVNREGVFTHFNHSAEKILGLQRLEILGKKASEVLPGFPFKEVLSEGVGFEGREILVHCNDRRFHLISSARPMESQEGIVGVVATFNDFREVQQFAYQIANKQQTFSFDDIIGISSALKETKEKARKIAKSNSTVLILGESGTGKELFARAIHKESPQSHKPFIAINCGAIPEALLESELFGYEEGAFTGARRGGKPGKFEIANGGTVLLDEIGNMSLYLQVKLLRVLQERQIERVGGNKTITLDFRLIAATNNNLQDMVIKGEFREDLFYRLNVIPLHIPPLRERQEDIEVLLDYYLERYRSLINKDIKGFTVKALSHLLRYSWPGNVRELVNAVECAVNLEDGPMITEESLPSRIRDYTQSVRTNTGTKTLQELEKEAILAALNRCGWSEQGKQQAADMLGISRSTIYRKLSEYKLSGF